MCVFPNACYQCVLGESGTYAQYWDFIILGAVEGAEQRAALCGAGRLQAGQQEAGQGALPPPPQGPQHLQAGMFFYGDLNLGT